MPPAIEFTGKQLGKVWHLIPVFHGPAARRRLTRAWGLPNSFPTPEEERRLGVARAACRTRRVVFVDDEQGGKPVAVWLP